MEITTAPPQELTETELDEIQGGQGAQVCASSVDGDCICKPE
ncbi:MULTISPECIES: bacteriocin [Amycolatopsis]|nr:MULTISPECIES: bacteriocin [Amycolatopsis]SDU11590.1 bacteriocin-type signal sequence-containing protein [Amycolatopsis keratiniphila]